MQTTLFRQFGNPSEVLECVEQARPEPGPGEVRIRLLLAPIHNHELATVRGQYGFRPPLPATGGSEACGIVDAIGAGVERFHPGQRVAVARILGTWAEFFLAPARALVAVPDAIDDASACQLLSMPVSALMLLESLAPRPDAWIVQNAANGAVGKTLAVIARQRGIPVLHLVRSAAAAAELAALGIAPVVSTDLPDWPKTVRALTAGKPIIAAIDSISGVASGELLHLLDEGGVLVSFGALSGEAMQVSPGDLIFKQATIRGFWASKIGAINGRSAQDLVREIIDLALHGALPLPVEQVFPLAQIKAAATAALAGGRKGKILLRP